jgi:hypothetical protein
VLLACEGPIEFAIVHDRSDRFTLTMDIRRETP